MSGKCVVCRFGWICDHSPFGRMVLRAARAAFRAVPGLAEALASFVKDGHEAAA